MIVAITISGPRYTDVLRALDYHRRTYGSAVNAAAAAIRQSVLYAEWEKANEAATESPADSTAGPG